MAKVLLSLSLVIQTNQLQLRRFENYRIQCLARKPELLDHVMCVNNKTFFVARLFPSLPDGQSPSSPEVGLGELFHVELLVCERGQVDVTNSWEHFT